MRGPVLQPGVVLIEQHYRGERGYVLKDPATRKYYRFGPGEAAVIQALDGTRTIEEVAEHLTRQGLATTAAAVDAFARTLSRMGLLQRSMAERARHQLERLRTERRRQRELFRGEWLRMRWSLGDADAAFTRWLPAVRWCFTRPFVVASLMLFATYAAILVARWPEFLAAVMSTFAPSAMGLDTLVVYLGVMLGLTAVHELGHGFTCKHYGGEVRELGFMLLYFTPSFYCNVNDAWSFPDRRARLWVTAAGSWIELAVTGVAAIVWAIASPGTLVADIALAAVLIGGFMAVLTNANPLMPLDGYFALSDYLEVPNLRHRASAYLGWWVQRHLLRLDLPEPDVAPSERRLLLTYGALALLHAIAFLTIVAWLVIGWLARALGAGAAILAVLLLVGVLWRQVVTTVRGVMTAARAQLGAAGWRRWRRRGPLAAVLSLGVLALVPWPLRSTGPFRVAPIRSQAIVAQDSGVVAAVRAAGGAPVRAGAPLVELAGFDLARLLARAEREADSLENLGRAARAADQAGTMALASAQGQQARAEVNRLRAHRDRTVLRAPFAGTVVTLRPEEQLGRWVEPGDTLLQVADLSALEARIALGGIGATRVAPGQRVRLVAGQSNGMAVEGVVREVAAAGLVGRLEVRVDLPADAGLQPGAGGVAQVHWARSSILGALWWAVRARIRSDLLL